MWFPDLFQLLHQLLVVLNFLVLFVFHSDVKYTIIISIIFIIIVVVNFIIIIIIY